MRTGCTVHVNPGKRFRGFPTVPAKAAKLQDMASVQQRGEKKDTILG